MGSPEDLKAVGVHVHPQFSLSPEQLVEIVSFDNRDKPEQVQLLVSKGGVEGIGAALAVQLSGGLSTSADFDHRRHIFGSNEIPSPKSKSFWELVKEAFGDRVLQILVVGSLIVFAVGMSQDPATGWHEGISIAVTVMIVVLCSCGNDWNKERKFRKVMALSQQKYCKVFRSGKEHQIWFHDVVVGDVILLAMGDEIPADGLFIDGKDVTVDESPLTGETHPVKKSSKAPFMFSGCQVTEGAGRMLVTTVGRRSTGGQILELLSQATHTTTPLQEKLGLMAVQVSKVAGVVALATWLALMGHWVASMYLRTNPDDPSQMGWKWMTQDFCLHDSYTAVNEHCQRTKAHGFYLVENFIVAVTLLVVAIPDGLPLATTISLAHAMTNMAKDQNFVRHLDASETMGEATCICSDKTGTLTENRMTVVKGYFGEQVIDASEVSPSAFSPAYRALLSESISLNSTCFIDFDKEKNNQMVFVGSKTEGALLVFAGKLGCSYEEVRKKIPKVSDAPFTSDRKRMSTIVQAAPHSYRIFTKGASEIVLGLCTTIMDASGVQKPLSLQDKHKIDDLIRSLASEGLRTITLAYRDLEAPSEEPQTAESDLCFLGMVGIKDPVRPEVPEAVAQCQRAGLTVRMVTGDNILTAKKIAEECGILKPGGLAMEGPTFRALSDEDKDKVIPSLQVLARSSPADKFILVQRLKRMGEVVAVTGDGTNDAPALKEADIGFSMGISGTDIAKNASDIVLLDDNFGSIVKAILWGRNVYDCISKFLQFQFAINLTSCLLTLVAAAMNRGMPLNAVQLLWINLIMDTLGALAIATDFPDMDILNRPPNRKKDPILTYGMKCYVLSQAAWQISVQLYILYSGYAMFQYNGRPVESDDVVRHTTLVFNINIFMQIVNEINGRHLKFEANLFKRIWKNHWFVPILVFIAVVQVILVQLGSDFVGTTPLSGSEWAGCIVIALAGFPMGWVSQLIHSGPIVEAIRRRRGRRVQPHQVNIKPATPEPTWTEDEKKFSASRTC